MEPVMEHDGEYLSQHFTIKEFMCKCGCQICNVDPILLVKLEMLRVRLGKPISINSGCRCKKYNERTGGKPDSKHITSFTKACLAADIHAPRGVDRYLILKEAFYLDFFGIGVGDSFVHLDARDINPTVWHY